MLVIIDCGFMLCIVWVIECVRCGRGNSCGLGNVELKGMVFGFLIELSMENISLLMLILVVLVWCGLIFGFGSGCCMCW